MTTSIKDVTKPSAANDFENGCLQSDEDGHNLNSWLADFQNESLLDLWCIPATHHSATAILCPSTSHHRKERYLDRVGNAIRRIPYVWARTQSLCVSEQLKIGVRILDIRVDCDFRISHSLSSNVSTKDDECSGGGGASTDLESVLIEIKDFLDNNPSEFVMVLFRQDLGCGINLSFLSTAQPQIRIDHDVEATHRFLNILSSSGLTFAKDFCLGDDEIGKTMKIGQLAGTCVFFLCDFHRYEFLKEAAEVVGKVTMKGSGLGFSVEERNDTNGTSRSYGVVIFDGPRKGRNDEARKATGTHKKIYLYEYYGSGIDTAMQIWQTTEQSTAKFLIQQYLAHECHAQNYNDDDDDSDSDRAQQKSNKLASFSNYSQPRMSLGGVCLDASFIPYPPSWTSPNLNRWFLDEYCSETAPSTSTNDKQKQSRRPITRLGMIMCDFITKEMSARLIQQNYNQRQGRETQEENDKKIATVISNGMEKEVLPSDVRYDGKSAGIFSSIYNQLATTINDATTLRPVFRVGPNNRGGIRRVEINPTGYPLLSDIFPSKIHASSSRFMHEFYCGDGDNDEYIMNARTEPVRVEMYLLSKVRNRYNSYSDVYQVEGRCSHQRCFAVKGYMTDHPQETYEARAVKVRIRRKKNMITDGDADLNVNYCQISWRLFLDISRTDKLGHGWGNELWLEFV